MKVFAPLVMTLGVLLLATSDQAMAGELSGRTLVYEKSNLDGSNSGRIAVRFEAGHVIESFKWHPGSNHATLVRADIDPRSMTVQRFRGFSVDAQSGTSLRAELIALGSGAFSVRLGDS